MCVGNGSSVDVISIETLPLHLPSGLVINLNNCYLVPTLSMNIVFGSCLMRSGYSFKSENNGCSIYMNDIFYGHALVMNGLFLLDLDNSVTHIDCLHSLCGDCWEPQEKGVKQYSSKFSLSKKPRLSNQ